MASTERMREAVDQALAKANDARIMRETYEREVAEVTQVLQAAMRSLVAAEAAEEAAMHEAEYAHEAMQDAEIARHEEYLATLDW